MPRTRGHEEAREGVGDVANEPPTVLLADADVLIDYRESDLSVLKEVGRRIGRLTVLSEVAERSIV